MKLSELNRYIMNKKLILTIILLVTLVYGSGATAKAETPLLPQDQIYDAQMEQWLDRLQTDESGKNPLLVILDTNNKYSYGCLQFQAGTWAPYSKKYNVDAEIMDCKAQRYVAKQMIKEDWNNWKHWKTSVTTKTAGKPPAQDKTTS